MGLVPEEGRERGGEERVGERRGGKEGEKREKKGD